MQMRFAVIFLIMTTLRIWFDLAEADIVLNDQRAVRKSIWSAFRQTFRRLGRLLASYLRHRLSSRRSFWWAASGSG